MTGDRKPQTDLLVIVRDALASSLAGSLLLAIEARNAGQDVAVLFTQEALAAAASGSFAWPRELTGQVRRLALADHGSAEGLPLLGRGEGRQIDARRLIARAGEAGVRLYACPIWASLLGHEGAAAGLQELDTAGLLSLVRETKQVIGAL